jgi:hypothetical protein
MQLRKRASPGCFSLVAIANVTLTLSGPIIVLTTGFVGRMVSSNVPSNMSPMLAGPARRSLKFIEPSLGSLAKCVLDPL